RDVQVVYRSLQKHNFSVGALHGDLDQRARMAALDAFRNGEVQLLVCSDVAEIEKLIARKIDWQDGAQLPPEEEAEAPARGRSRGRGGAHRDPERAEPVEAAGRPARHAEHRADSRRHRAARPAQESVPADQEEASSPPPARSADRAPRRDRATRERTAAGPANGEAPRASTSVAQA